MLKCDFHMHTNLDPYDKDKVVHSPYELIDHAASLGFEVLTITHHGHVLWSEELRRYAQEKDILLIPAAEAFVKGKHVLLLNVSQEDIDAVSSFDDLRELKKRKDVVAIAAHPFYPSRSCVLGDVIRHNDVFDALEYCHFYPWFFNVPNALAKFFAKRYGLPLVGTGDVHVLSQMGYTYSLVDCEKSVDGVLRAIRNGDVSVVSEPLPVSVLFNVFWQLIMMSLKAR